MSEKLLGFDEIKERKLDGKYIAYGNNGRKYRAEYTSEYGGVMFFTIPSDVVVLGYSKANEEEE